MGLKKGVVIGLILPAVFGFGQTDPVDRVDPFIGTGGHGHTYPGAAMPFGMVQLSPDTDVQGWDWCSGYHHSDHSIMGFSHTHLSGTGCADLGDILFMPFTGEVKWEPGPKSNPDKGYRSRFSHATEKASPGFYSVMLDGNPIKVELTVTRRCGFHRYTFLDHSAPRVLIDLAHGISDQSTETFLRKTADNEVTGFRRSRGWANDQKIFFVARFSTPIDDIQYQNGKREGPGVKAALTFSGGTPLLVRVGFSGVDAEGARKNLDAEIDHRDFDKIRNQARDTWNRRLSKIEIEGGRENDHTVFYTALYHAMLAPCLFSDVDGRYRGMDHDIHRTDDEMYTVFSLWDTYRAAHPLFLLLEPEQNLKFIRSMIRMYQESGTLPIWELTACETGCMIGYHAIPVIADAFLKGHTDFDVETAYRAMRHSAMLDNRGLDYYKKMGYIPCDKEGNSVSKTLEYAFDDWCIARMAQALGRKADAERFTRRSRFYANVFDPSVNFMRGRHYYGAFRKEFDPAAGSLLGSGDFTEANAWQYTWHVPHDVENLIRLMGGDEAFTAHLDALFRARMKEDAHKPADMTGLIGQYAHGNEPSHHVAYLYNFAGKPWKTQEKIREICDTLYGPGIDGLCGNEDCGQMSAWYVFSAMGFYPVTPGRPEYIIGTPRFDKVTLHLNQGKTFVISANHPTDRRRYIQSARLNGRPWMASFVDFDAFQAGGSLALVMGEEPNEAWGAEPAHRPRSYTGAAVESLNDTLVFTPYMSHERDMFTQEEQVDLRCETPDAVIHYTLDGSDPTTDSPVFQRPFQIRQSTEIKARAFKAGLRPSPVFRRSMRLSLIRREGESYPRVACAHPFSRQYPAGGENALVDGLSGTIRFNDGRWQGFQGVDADVTVDLGAVMPLKSITARFLRDHDVWVFLPSRVDFQLSLDGRMYRPLRESPLDPPQFQDADEIHPVSAEARGLKARYIRLKAQNIGRNPGWHIGAGGKSWIFMDEIVIEPDH